MMRNLGIVAAAFAIVAVLSGCARQAYYYPAYPEYWYSPRYAYPEYSTPPGPRHPPPSPELYGDDPNPYGDRDTYEYRGSPYRP